MPINFFCSFVIYIIIIICYFGKEIIVKVCNICCCFKKEYIEIKEKGGEGDIISSEEEKEKEALKN